MVLAPGSEESMSAAVVLRARNAASFTRKMGSVANSIRSAGSEAEDLSVQSQQTAGSMAGMAASADQASDEIDEVGRSSSSATRRLAGLQAASISQQTAFRSLALTTGATLVPAVGALTTAIVPLTASLGAAAAATVGLVGAFGAVIGTGLLAWGEQMKEQNAERLGQVEAEIEQLEDLEDVRGDLTDQQRRRLVLLKDRRTELRKGLTAFGAMKLAMKDMASEIQPLLIEFGQQFIPLIQAAIDSLPLLVERILEATGNMEPFQEALADAGEAAMTFLPALTGQLFDMARAALPSLRALGRFIVSNLIPILQSWGDTLGDVMDLLPNLGQAAMDLLGTMNRFGMTVLEVVVPAVNQFGDELDSLMEHFNRLSEAQQKIALKGLFVAPGAAGLLAILLKIHPALAAIAVAAGALGMAWKTNFMDIQGHTQRALDSLQAFVDDLNLGPVREELKDSGQAAQSMFQKFMAGDISGGFSSLETMAANAMDAFRRVILGTGGSGGLNRVFRQALNDVNRFMQTTGARLFAEALPSLVSVFQDAGEEIIRVLVGKDGKGGILTTLSNFLQTYWSETFPKLMGGAMEAVGTVTRQAFIDIFVKPFTGKDSAFWDALADVTVWLINNLPGLFISVGVGIVRAIIEGVKGLYDGLVGKSELKDQLIKVANWFTVDNLLKVMGDMGGVLVDFIVGGLSGLATKLGQAIIKAGKKAKKMATSALTGEGVGGHTTTGKDSSGVGMLDIPESWRNSGPMATHPRVATSFTGDRGSSQVEEHYNIDATVEANDRDGGRRAAREFVNELRSQGFR